MINQEGDSVENKKSSFGLRGIVNRRITSEGIDLNAADGNPCTFDRLNWHLRPKSQKVVSSSALNNLGLELIETPSGLEVRLIDHRHSMKIERCECGCTIRIQSSHPETFQEIAGLESEKRRFHDISDIQSKSEKRE